MDAFWSWLGWLLSFLAAVYMTLMLFLLLGGLALSATLCTPEWRNSQAIYLRNRTTVPMLLTLTVPRAALERDTVWWGTYPRNSFSYGEIGYALRLTGINVPGLRYPTPSWLPALLWGSTSKLTYMRIWPEQRYDYVPRWDLEPWLTRQQQLPPTTRQLAQAVVLRPLPAAPDSVRLTFALAPDSSLRVALRTMRLHHSDPDAVEATEELLRPKVQWMDAQAHLRQQQAPLGAWLREQDAAAKQEKSQNFHLIRYVDYR